MLDFKGFGNWIEIFEGGSQVDDQGRVHDGDTLIDRAVSTFNPAFHEPPLVKGHPKDNDPSYGWVQGLKTAVRNGTKILLAKCKDVVPEFEEMVKQGRYKKRSASFYKDGRLRHVGFLGAVPPSVKGLADLKFGDDGDAIFFEFSGSDKDKAAQQARSKKYGISIKDGGHVTKPGQWAQVPDDQFLDPVNYRYPCPDADQIRSAASYWDQADNQKQYTPEERAKITARLDTFRKKFKIGKYREGGKMKFKEFMEFFKFWKQAEEDPDLDMPSLIGGSGKGNKSFTEADLEAAKKEAAEAERKKVEAEFAENNRTAQREAQNKEISSFCDDLIEKKKIPPSWKSEGLVDFMKSLDGSSEISFAENADKKTPLEWFKNFLEGFGENPIFREMATKDAVKDAIAFAEAKKDQDLGESIAAKVNPKS